MDALAFGCLAALIADREDWLTAIGARVRIISVTAIFLLLLVCTLQRSGSSLEPLMATVGYTGFALAYACLVFAAFFHAGSATLLASLLRAPLLRAFGKYSYGIYVFTFPIAYFEIKLALEYSSKLPEYGRMLLWITCIVVGVRISYGVAWLSWQLLEKHFLKLKHLFLSAAPENSGIPGMRYLRNRRRAAGGRLMDRYERD